MPKLHLAYLVEDVEYPIPEELQASKEELPHSSRVKRQQSSFPAVNQAEAGEEDEQLETEDAETFATDSATPRRNAALSAAILRVLEVANAKPTPVEHTGSYSGRKRRSAQQSQQLNTEDAETFSTAPTTPGRNAALSAAILRVLEVANAKPTPVELSGSYSGRKKRSAQQSEQPNTAEDVETFSTAPTTPGRNAALSAAILRVLEVANAKPTPVELSGSYSGKKRRSAQLEPVHSNAHQYGLLEPKVELVKVKSHGNFGKVVQASDVAPSPHHAKLEHGRKKRSDVNFDNFVPFSVYDDRRVKLLKVEENDFHALPRVIASNKKKRADLEKVEEEEAKVHVVQLTADQ